jgi:hypothetical protein
LLVLVEVRRHPRVKDDKRIRPADCRRHAGQVRDHVALFEAGRVVGGLDVGQSGTQPTEAGRVVRPLAGEQPEGGVVGKGVERGEVEADAIRQGRRPQLGERAKVVTGGTLDPNRRTIGT